MQCRLACRALLVAPPAAAASRRSRAHSLKTPPLAFFPPPPPCRPAPSLAAALHRRYAATRLALCRFACQRQQALALLLVVELALCVAWLAISLLRGAGVAAGAEEEDEQEAGAMRGYHRGTSEQQQQEKQQQVLIASAADPQWQAELKRPLLGGGPAGSSASCC